LKQDNINIDYRIYVSLLSMNYQRIYNFILMLVASHNNADDIMQETTLAMFEKFNSFEKGSDFLAWAKTIAKYKTLEFLKTQKKDKVVFNQKIVDLIDQDSQKHQTKQEEWIEALRKCVSLLPKSDRQLLHIRYYENERIPAIAGRVGCSFQRIYRNMARINGVLVRCVRQKIGTAEL
jgi:RNA polymerase sigma-70 factor (ECF subfamily)